LIIDVRQRFFDDRNVRDASNQIALGHNRYQSGAWLRDRSAAACPARIAEDARGTYWAMLRLVEKSLSAERIRKIIGQFEVTHGL